MGDGFLYYLDLQNELSYNNGFCTFRGSGPHAFPSRSNFEIFKTEQM